MKRDDNALMYLFSNIMFPNKHNKAFFFCPSSVSVTSHQRYFPYTGNQPRKYRDINFCSYRPDLSTLLLHLLYADLWICKLAPPPLSHTSHEQGRVISLHPRPLSITFSCSSKVSDLLILMHRLETVPCSGLVEMRVVLAPW